MPPFVSYLHPSEIWRGYSAEANRRAGYSLSPAEVDRYWNQEALTFIDTHRAQVLGDVPQEPRMALERGARQQPLRDEERMFSPVLAWLPAPAWLLAMGLAGLVWLAREDRRWPVVAVPIALAWFTMAVFFSESRFRFHATPMLALCSGVWIDQLMRHARDAQQAAVGGLRRVGGGARGDVAIARQPHPTRAGAVGPHRLGLHQHGEDLRGPGGSGNVSPKSSPTMHRSSRPWATPP